MYVHGPFWGVCSPASLPGRHDLLLDRLRGISMLHDHDGHHAAMCWGSADRTRVPRVYEESWQLYTGSLPVFHGGLSVRVCVCHPISRDDEDAWWAHNTGHPHALCRNAGCHHL